MLNIKIINPDKTIFNDKIISVIVPGVDGKFAIFANHAPMVSKISEGEISLTLKDETVKNIAIGEGFLEVKKDNIVIILMD